MNIDADAHHHMGHMAALPLQGHLREDARQLAPSQHQVIGPLDLRPNTGHPLNGTADSHGAESRQRQELLRGAVGPPKDGEKQALACRGLEAAAPAPSARRLAIRQHRRAVRGPLQGQAAAERVGGVHRFQHPEILPGPGQIPLHRLPGEEIRRAHEPVAPACAGLDIVSLAAQGLHRLPHGGPADAQGPAQLLAGEIVPGLLQSTAHTLLTHARFLPST